MKILKNKNPSILGTGGSADVFGSAHEWFLRVVVSWPQHHGNLGPEGGESSYAHIRVIRSRADLSQENLNLSGNGVLTCEVCSNGGDHGGAVGAGVGRGDGKLSRTAVLTVGQLCQETYVRTFHSLKVPS